MGADWSPSQGQLVGGRYELRDVIGTGGMGVVYAGFDRRLERPVAVKFLNPTAAMDPAALARFQREALAAGKIGHENICDVRDLGTTDQGAPYIVMELLDGAPLSDRLIAQGRMTPEEAIPIIVQVLAALDAAHAAGIVHRDLKPENVFLVETNSGEQRVKLVDFGISKALGDVTDLRLTETGVVVGSPYYMSPEQARGRKDIDGRTDLWSVGVILYELLTGQLPFVGENYNEVMIKIVTEEPVPPREVNPEIPPGLNRIIMGALTKSRDDRYGSARELAVALSSDSARLFSVSTSKIEPGRPRRVGLAVGLAAVLVVLLAGAIIGFLVIGAGGEAGEVARVSVEEPPAPEVAAASMEAPQAPAVASPAPAPAALPPARAATPSAPAEAVDATAPAEASAPAAASTPVEASTPAAASTPGEQPGARPASDEVAVSLVGVPDGATLAFDGTVLEQPRLVGAPGHRGELVVTVEGQDPVRIPVTLSEGLVVDLNERFRAARSSEPGAGRAERGERAEPRRRRDESRRPPRGRFIKGRNSRITLDYEKA